MTAAVPASAAPLALVGMPGCGKSTVGRQLARQLGWRFADSDHEIEQRIGGSIRAYFEQHGEAAFRDLEQGVIGQLCQQTSLVLATGGGAVLREVNRIAESNGGHLAKIREHLPQAMTASGQPLKKLDQFLLMIGDG